MIARATICALRPYILFVVMGLLWPYSSTTAQTATGRIIGTVTDTQGAPVPGAKVTVTNTATNVQSTTVTNDAGFYQLLELPIGTYTVTAEHSGFSKAVTAPQSLDINQALRIDVHMRIGSVVEIVTVEAQAAQVETVSPTIGGLASCFQATRGHRGAGISRTTRISLRESVSRGILSGMAKPACVAALECSTTR
jgi:hypothetical protein